MNKLDDGINISSIILSIKRNILVFLFVVALFLGIGIVGGVVFFLEGYSVECSAVITTTNTDLSAENYIDTVQYYSETIKGFVEDDVILGPVSNRAGMGINKLKSAIDVNYNGGILKIVYRGGKTLDEAKTILNDVLNTLVVYVDNNEISDIKGKLQIVSYAKENTDPDNSILVFVSAMLIIGIVTAVLVSLLKTIYSKYVIDITYIEKKTKLKISSKLKSDTKKESSNDLEVKKLLLQLSRLELKTINFASIDGKKKDIVLSFIVNGFCELGHKILILDCASQKWDNNLECDYVNKQYTLFKFSDNELEKDLNKYKEEYDFVFVINNEKENTPDLLAINKYTDTTLIEIEIGKTRKRELVNTVEVLEKDNSNLISVIFE